MAVTFAHPNQSDIDPRLMGILLATGMPLNVTSGYRTPEYNRRVGGASKSRHMHRDAVDLSLEGMDEPAREDLMRRLIDAGALRLGLYSQSPNMLHVDLLQMPHGGRHFMYDRTANNIEQAPAYFQRLAGYEPSQSARYAPPGASENSPRPSMIDPSALVAQSLVQAPQPNIQDDPMFWLMLAGGIDPSSMNPLGGIGPAMAGYQKLRFDQQLDEVRLQNAARKQQALRQVASQEADPAVAAAIQAGLLPPSAIANRLGIDAGSDVSYGTTPHYERDPDGSVYVVRYANDGTKIREPTQGAPFALESKTPGFLQRVAEAKALGAAFGEDKAAAIVDLPTIESSATRSLQTIDALLSDQEGMRRAVGMNSLLPSIPGGKAADYEVRLDQLYGQNFLQAYQDLKGGGAISESEGKKAEQAIAAISTAQSIEAHRAALEELRGVVVRGLEKARKKAGAARESGETIDMGGGWSVRVK